MRSTTHAIRTAAAGLIVLLSTSCDPGTDGGTSDPDLPEENYALQFDGTSTYLEIPSLEAQQPGTLTLELMVRFDTVHAGLIPLVTEAGSAGWGAGYGFALKCEAGLLVWRVVTPDVVIDCLPSFSPDTGRWYHIACNYDGLVSRIWVNSQLVFQHMQDMKMRAIYYLDRATWIGRSLQSEGGSVYFKGQIDELRMWKIYRSRQQLETFRYVRIEPAPSTLIGYWNADGRTDVPDILTDRSPLHNHARVHGQAERVRSTVFDQ